MPRFPDLETPFRKRARRLRTPLHALFDPADWTEAFAAIEHPAPEDRRLLEAALWIGEEAAALRLVHDDVFAGLAPETAIAMGVAVINNAYRTSEANRKAAGEDIPAVGSMMRAACPYRRRPSRRRLQRRPIGRPTIIRSGGLSSSFSTRRFTRAGIWTPIAPRTGCRMAGRLQTCRRPG